MEQTHAGGRNTQAQPSAAEASLEAGLQGVAREVAALFADARGIDPAQDEYGHARSRIYTDAVQLLKVSAKLGHTIAELRGNKFEHNINVRRQDVAATESSDSGEGEGTLFRFGDDTLWDWKTKRTYVLDPSRGPDGRPAPEGSGEEGTPLPISRGSNGNFGNGAAAQVNGMAAAEPKVRNQ
jgi:hypothetical protein